MKGSLTISRVTGGREPEEIRIRITDESSRVQFVEMKMTPENFARCITGLGYVEGDFEVRDLHLVGSIGENKEELVRCEPPYGNEKKMAKARAAMRKMEVDGWRGCESDLRNHHRCSDDGVMVMFYRNVDAKTGKPIK